MSGKELAAESGKAGEAKTAVRPGGNLRFTLILLAVLAVATLAAYSNSFSVPFYLDDDMSIVKNYTIRSFSAFKLVLPQKFRGATADGRPLVNFTLLLNYLAGGLAVYGYHVVNLLIHLVNGALLFAVVKKLCETSRLAPDYGARSRWIAFAVSLLWLLHPLQTESVTYIVQRAEALMAMCYLGAVACFLTAMEGKKEKVMLALSVGCCFLGTAAKEVIVTAPLVIYLLDVFFVARSWRGALKKRALYYAALVASWISLALLMLSTDARMNSVGFSMTVTWLDYAGTQFYALARYLWLIVWPSNLIFDYGTHIASDPTLVLPCLALILAIVVAIAVGIPGLNPAAFAGGIFFIILSPTTSFIPIANTLSEHRLYLPLAAVIALAVFFADWLSRRYGGGGAKGRNIALGTALMLCAVALGATTYARNEVYRDSYDLWKDTAEKAPLNERALTNYGNMLYQRGEFDKALELYRRVDNMKAAYRWAAVSNQGYALLGQGKEAEAYRQFKEAEKLAPEFAEAKYNIAMMLDAMNRPKEALQYYAEALSLDPAMAEAHNNYANVLVKVGRDAEAETHYKKALELLPEYFLPAYNLADLYFGARNYPAALEYFTMATKIDPAFADAWNNRGSVLMELGRFDEAADSFRRCLEIEPAHEFAKKGLEGALSRKGAAFQAR